MVELKLTLTSGFSQSERLDESDPVGMRVNVEQNEEGNYLVCLNELFYDGGYDTHSNGVYLNMDEARALHNLLGTILASGKIERPVWSAL